MCKNITIATIILSIIFWMSGCYTKIGYPPPDYSVAQKETGGKRSVEGEREVEEEAYRPTRYRGYNVYEEYYYPDYSYPIFELPWYSYYPLYSYYDYYDYPYRRYRHHYYYWYDDGVKVKKRKQYTRETINRKYRKAKER